MAGSVAHNDALPLLLFAAALERLFARRGPLPPFRGAVVGLLLAATASSKLSYAPPAGVIGLLTLSSQGHNAHRRTSLAFLSGAALGTLPMLLLASFAPTAFVFQVGYYNLDAVRAWAAERGELWRLSPPFRLLEWAFGMAKGPLLAVLIDSIALRRRGPPPTLTGLAAPLGPVVGAALIASLPRRCPVTDASIARIDADPPRAVLTGTQRNRPAAVPGGLDGLLDRWAWAHGYHAVDLQPNERLWLAPRKQ